MNRIALKEQKIESKAGRGKRAEKHREIEPAYATVVEAAAFMRISRGMVVKMIHAGEIPYRQFGRSFRIPWDHLRKQVPQ